jgi:hypothetical protein
VKVQNVNQTVDIEIDTLLEETVTVSSDEERANENKGTFFGSGSCGSCGGGGSCGGRCSRNGGYH